MYRNPTAIVIDDDKDTVDVFCEYLKMLNVAVLGVAYNGKAAADLYHQTNPDVVFLDLMMPEYDGIHALENILKTDPAAKIVIITGDLWEDAEKKLEELRPIKIIFKPFDLNEIVAVIEEIKKRKNII
jgi:DNA-binding response OmpR family regulator